MAVILLIKITFFHKNQLCNYKIIFDTEEELCEIDAILIKNKSAKNPGYLHALNDTPGSYTK